MVAKNARGYFRSEGKCIKFARENYVQGNEPLVLVEYCKMVQWNTRDSLQRCNRVNRENHWGCLETPSLKYFYLFISPNIHRIWKKIFIKKPKCCHLK